MWLGVGYLLALGAAVIFAPSRARRFLAAFAQTPRANALEAAVRLLAGLAFIGAAPRLRVPVLGLGIGLFLAATALLMLILPGAHKRFATRSVAAVGRLFGLFGIAAIALAAMLALLLS